MVYVACFTTVLRNYTVFIFLTIERIETLVILSYFWLKQGGKSIYWLQIRIKDFMGHYNIIRFVNVMTLQRLNKYRINIMNIMKNDDEIQAALLQY